MNAPVLLTGGTGTLGRAVLPLLLDAGCQVRVLSRHVPDEKADNVTYVAGDLSTGEGVDAAMQGIGTVVHCAGSAKGDEVKARNLVQAASKAGVRHIVNISVVGADRVPVVSGVDRAAFGYYGAKRGAEEVIANSGIPWTTLRATQFHDLTLTFAQQLAKLPVVPVPSGMQVQPVDAREVAARMAELALGEPAGLVDDIAGPRVYGLDDVVRDYLKAAHKHRLLMPMWTPGKAAKAMRSGANLSLDHAVGQRTWEDFLAERVN